MVLFRKVALRLTYCDWPKDAAKTVAKHAHQNQASNIASPNNYYVTNGTKLTRGKRQILINRVHYNMLSGIDCANLLNSPESKKDVIKLVHFISKHIRVEIYLQFHRSSKVGKIHGDLLKKR